MGAALTGGLGLTAHLQKNTPPDPACGYGKISLVDPSNPMEPFRNPMGETRAEKPRRMKTRKTLDWVRVGSLASCLEPMRRALVGLLLFRGRWGRGRLLGRGSDPEVRNHVVQAAATRPVFPMSSEHFRRLRENKEEKRNEKSKRGTPFHEEALEVPGGLEDGVPLGVEAPAVLPHEHHIPPGPGPVQTSMSVCLGKMFYLLVSCLS